jgi:hypothetical protein
MLVVPAGAGEIVKRTFTKADGSTVSGYVFSTGKSSRSRGSSYSNRTRYGNERYPAYRSYGYTYVGGSGYRGGYTHYQRTGRGCGYRPTTRTTRTAITYNAARPVTIAPRGRGGVTVFRRR